MVDNGASSDPEKNISYLVSQINTIAVDRDAMINYFPSLSLADYSNVVDHFTKSIAQIVGADRSEIGDLHPEKVRRFLKKLILMINSRWLIENVPQD